METLRLERLNDAAVIKRMIDARIKRVAPRPSSVILPQITFGDTLPGGGSSPETQSLIAQFTVPSSSTYDVEIGLATEFQSAFFDYTFLTGTGDYGIGRAWVYHNGTTTGGGSTAEEGDGDSGLIWSGVLSGGIFIARLTNAAVVPGDCKVVATIVAHPVIT